MADDRLKNRRMLITGGAGGVGRGTAARSPGVDVVTLRIEPLSQKIC